jgi:HAD superfamily hydrolase (TIGR01549 family)
MPSKTHEAVLVSLKNELGYPGSPPKALLSTLFDEVYHGPELFRRMYGVEAEHYRKKGLIENERLLIKRRDLTNTNRILGGQRLAIITGRPYLATEHVLNDILGCFNVQASLFLGDIDVHPELAPKLASYRKPNGEGLNHIRRALSSTTLLYVGDSAEDIEMVENARRDHELTLSAGIYGASLNQSEQLRFFLGRGTDIILPSARRVSDILRMVRHEKRAD